MGKEKQPIQIDEDILSELGEAMFVMDELKHLLEAIADRLGLKQAEQPAIGAKAPDAAAGLARSR